MPERYEIISHDKSIQAVPNCPVILKAHAITKDHQTGKTIAQFKFENLSKGTVSALYISVQCRGQDGTELQGVERFAYLDLQTRQYQEFGGDRAVPLPIAETRACKAFIIKILFADGSEWNGGSANEFTPLPKAPGLPYTGDLLRQYHKEIMRAGKCEHKTQTVRQGDLILCGCGKVYLESETACPCCGINAAKIAEISDPNFLKNELEKEQQAAQQHQQKAKRQQKRLTKIFAVSAAAVAALAVLGKTIAGHLEQERKYQAAVQLVQEEQYSQALTALEALNGYKDSETYIQAAQDGLDAEREAAAEQQKEATYQKALEAYEVENYDEAKELFGELEEYKDAAQYLEKCDEASREALYQEALQDYENGLLGGAYFTFDLLTEYEYADSAAYAEKIATELAAWKGLYVSVKDLEWQEKYRSDYGENFYTLNVYAISEDGTTYTAWPCTDQPWDENGNLDIDRILSELESQGVSASTMNFKVYQQNGNTYLNISEGYKQELDEESYQRNTMIKVSDRTL